MLVRKTLARRVDLFLSLKSTTAIPVGHHLVRDALIQAYLDSQVRSIDYILTAQVASQTVKLECVTRSRDDGRFLLDIVEARPSRTAGECALAARALRELQVKPLMVTERDILR